MKICFLGDGHHINTLNWVNYIANVLDHKVYLITFGRVETPKVNIKTYTLGPRSSTFLRYILCIPKLKKLIHDINPDILIGYRITSYGFMAASTGFHPLVLAAQGQNIAYNASKLKAYFSKYAVRRADLIHSWGMHMTQKLIEFSADPTKILTLPRGIDTNLFMPSAERSYDLQFYRLITTRGLNPDYNFKQILNAIRILSKSMRSFKYVIIGDGPYKASLVQEVKTLGLENFVEFVGKVKYEDLPTYLHTADIYVSTVITDGVSASLLEAMSCGVFPIVTNNSANELWIKDGVNGYLVNCGDYEGLERKIKEAMMNKELRRQSGEINRKLVLEKASIGKNMKAFESAWKNLVSN